MSKKPVKIGPGGKIKIANFPPPLPQTPPQRRIELSRTALIKIKDTSAAANKSSEAEQKEFVIAFDDLDQGDLLGRGQFGTVKKMHHKASNLTFAVKMIDDSLMETSNDKRNSEMMDLEVAHQIGDGCPYLLKFYGALHAESHIWILTEIMDTSLDRYYSKSFALNLPLPELFISKLSFAVLSGLEYMRKLKLMHRDIKPSNILLNYTGEIKLCDFGISGFTTNSVCSTFKGCQRYMPPEKIDPGLVGTGYSVKADIWSLGISLIELATGVHPFQDAVGFLGLIRCIVNNDAPVLDANKYSPEICAFINKTLIKKPDDRASCIELLGDVFVTKYENEPHDLDLIKKIIDEIKKDKIEA